MRKLSELPMQLNLYESKKRGGGNLGNVTARMAGTWRHSKRRVGGDWIASARYEGSTDELEEMFYEGLMREVRASVGGILVWRGFCAEVRLHLRGVEYVRSWFEMANRVKVIYTHIGTNQFTNGSAESGAWTSYNTPTTNAQSTTWVTDGTYSDHLVADAANDGATIQGGIAVTAGLYYECRCSVNIISGTWVLEIYREDTGAALGTCTYGTAGQYVMRCSIGDSSTYAGNIGVRLYCSAAAGEVYADAAVFQEGPCRAETSWYADTASQSEFGVMEEILLKAGMSDAAANALGQLTLDERAWPRTKAPNEFMALAEGESLGEDWLEMTFVGYLFSTRNRFTTVTGTDDCDDHISALLGLCEFVTAGIVDANTMQFQIDDQAPLRVWECLRDITLAGDASQNLWQIGLVPHTTPVGSDYGVDYRLLGSTPVARYRGGRVYHIAGGEMEPWFLEPGYLYVDDLLSMGPGEISGIAADDPKIMSVDEVEFDAGNWLGGGSGIRFVREVDDE